LPRTWRDIGIGDHVVAQESREDGWYDAIVMDVAGDMLTLRWLDYPKERRVLRHRLRVGLLYPTPNLTSAAGKSAKPSTSAKSAKQTPAGEEVHSELPRDWQQIDINHLVLAKDDGPCRSSWEAVVEKAGDILRLRWRDFPTVPVIERSRFALALICPDAE
jgi:hypothetical protein